MHPRTRFCVRLAYLPLSKTIGNRYCLGSETKQGPFHMGINTPSEISAELSIGATDQKMVRIFITTESQEIPMDFLAEEAEEIARELVAAATACREAS